MQSNSIPISFSKLSNKKQSIQITKVKASNKFSSCYDTLQSNSYGVTFSPYIRVFSQDKCITKHTKWKYHSHKTTKLTVFYSFLAKYFVEQYWYRSKWIEIISFKPLKNSNFPNKTSYLNFFHFLITLALIEMIKYLNVTARRTTFNLLILKLNE